MRNDFGELLREQSRRKSQAFRASIVSVNSDRSYQIRREDTGAEVKAQWGDVRVALAPGQYVMAMRTDLSGATAGSGYVILKFDTTNSRNSSNVARYSNTVRNVTETVSVIKSGGVIVSKITLVKGGAAVTVLIYGENFTTDPTYGDAGITNDVAVVRTASLITIVVEASAGMAVGLYSMTVAGVVIPNFFEVIP